MAQFLATTPFTVLADTGVRESLHFGQGPEAVVKFKVLYSDRFNFINGTTGKSTGASRSSIKRTGPLQYPPSPNLYAVDADLDPLPSGSIENDGHGWVSYPYCVVSVTFRALQFDFDGSTDPTGQPWTTTTFDSSADSYTAPDSVFHFQGGYTSSGAYSAANVPTQAPVGLIIPQCALTIKRYWIPYLPVQEMLTLLATPLNIAAFNLGNFICQPETLLFLGGPSQRDMDTLGDAVQTVEYKCMYRPISWNKFLHPDGKSGWQYLYDNNGNKPYQLGDFSTLP